MTSLSPPLPPPGRSKEDRIAELVATCTMFETDPCSKHYDLGRVIGSGAFSVVRMATQKQTKMKVAAKCIKKAMLDVHEVEAFIMEASVLKEMDHPNVIKLHAVYSEPDLFILITEFVEGGELFDRIVDKTFYTEREARDVVKGLLEVTAYFHAANIVHRDLKPENILLVHRDDDANFKLADFGFAKRVDLSKDHLITQCGTPGYVAPEVLRGKAYGNGVDIWSIGVITYILLCGYPPFHNDNRNALFQQVKKGAFEFHSPYWDNISEAAKDFIRLMLTVDPNVRPTAKTLLKLPWIAGANVGNVQLETALRQLRQFNAYRRFKAASIAVMTSVAFTSAPKRSTSVDLSTPV
ncbi:CAMK/CAMK1 protein kinase, variant [Aphanomyces invadans]|uniref:CAMK/CAMK1 protein kinase, variant n=1 Tax=Aphanomyces invadans TaxID=157072 RepID=A0A024TR14_9STRA|nr:CAMK/CAMK1 protein kinase, variant [Aphanomyces invadans]ETV96076.1 CAMK/CAMK1 protein kinase, variant [Aphanomyces invadans]|eukprot:XP_008875387.1 CAMK/CAMK1 protein kinase, variant [Aphanomyces invadans]